MSLVFTLKMLSDICFYYSYINLLGYPFGGAVGLEVLIPFLLAAWGSALRPQQPLWRYLPLACLLTLGWFTPHNLAAFLLLLPPIIYLIWQTQQLESFSGRFDYSDILSLFLRSYLPFALVMAIPAGAALQESIPFALLCFGTGVSLQRMVRHDPEVFLSRRFAFFNGLTVLLTVVLGVSLGSPPLRYLYRRVLATIYLRIIAPILLFIVTGLGYLFVPVFYYLQKLFTKIPEEGFTFQIEEIAPLEELGVTLAQEKNTLLMAVVYAALLALLVYVIYKLFRKLNVEQLQSRSDPGLTERRFTLPSSTRGSQSSGRLTPLRALYRRYMQACQTTGFHLSHITTTADLERFSQSRHSNRELPSRLRALYLPVRYGEATPSLDDLNEAREIVAELQKTK